jgi:hypothetical protein
MARRAGRGFWTILVVVSSVGLGATPAARAQSPDARLCKLLPVAHIEKVLGGKASKPVGMDITPTIGNCSVQVPDAKHMVIVSTAALTGQGGRSIEERTKLGLKMMETSKAPKPKATYQFLGDVVCALEEMTPPMKQMTCMTDHGQKQFNLVVRSDKQSQLKVDAVKQLLLEAVAKVK